MPFVSDLLNTTMFSMLTRSSSVIRHFRSSVIRPCRQRFITGHHAEKLKFCPSPLEVTPASPTRCMFKILIFIQFNYISMKKRKRAAGLLNMLTDIPLTTNCYFSYLFILIMDITLLSNLRLGHGDERFFLPAPLLTSHLQRAACSCEATGVVSDTGRWIRTALQCSGSTEQTSGGNRPPPGH